MPRSLLHRAALAGALVLLAPLGGARCAHAWGAATHHYIAQHYSQHLPHWVDGLRAYDSVVDQHVTDPDTRKSYTPGESERHFIDIDWYPEFLAGTLTHSRSALETEYGASTVTANGVLPWIMGDVVDTLAAQFATGRWSAAALTIADLCHYAGDATQPLHCSKNYDGQYTGNSGIHSRYESTMMSPHIVDLSTPVIPISGYASPVDVMFREITDSWGCVAGLLQADVDAKAASGGSYNTTYYNTLWSETQAMTRARVDTATVLTASLVYTAWLDAGRPTVPGSSVSVGEMPLVVNRLVVGPTPFRGVLNISYAGPGPLVVDVYDVRGARVAHVVDGAGGAGSATWRPASGGHTAGLYFVRLRGPAGTIVRRVTRLD